MKNYNLKPAVQSREFCGALWGTLWGHPRGTLGALWGHSGGTLGTLWGHSGDTHITHPRRYACTCNVHVYRHTIHTHTRTYNVHLAHNLPTCRRKARSHATCLVRLHHDLPTCPRPSPCHCCVKACSLPDAQMNTRVGLGAGTLTRVTNNAVN